MEVFIKSISSSIGSLATAAAMDSKNIHFFKYVEGVVSEIDKKDEHLAMETRNKVFKVISEAQAEFFNKNNGLLN